MKLIQKARFGAFVPILLILFFGVVGCKNTDDGRYSYKAIEGEKVKFVDGDDRVPPMPKSGLNDETLAGVDSDGDGVRDDVEIWINENSEIRAIRLSLKEIARNLSLGMVNHTDRDLTYKYNLRIGEARACMLKVYGSNYRIGHAQIDSVYEEVVNTSLRTKAYLKMDMSLSGRAFPLNTDNPCEVMGITHE